jgi:predicted nucleic acid-binding protein
MKKTVHSVRNTARTDAKCARLAETAAIETIFSDAHQRALRIQSREGISYWLILVWGSTIAAGAVLYLRGF